MQCNLSFDRYKASYQGGIAVGERTMYIYFVANLRRFAAVGCCRVEMFDNNYWNSIFALHVQKIYPLFSF